MLAGLVFVGAFIYDVLCGFFYFAALAYYVNIREAGASLRPLQLLGFLALICYGAELQRDGGYASSDHADL